MRIPRLTNPRICVVDLLGSEAGDLVKSDLVFLKRLFGEVTVMDGPERKCDVLFVYAKLTPEGAVVGSPVGLREIIRDADAKVVVVASPNSGQSYTRACSGKSYGRSNLVMTLDRRDDSFGRFFSALFSKMKGGTSMPVAWTELSPQAPRTAETAAPEMIFACEIGPLVFG